MADIVTRAPPSVPPRSQRLILERGWRVDIESMLRLLFIIVLHRSASTALGMWRADEQVTVARSR